MKFTPILDFWERVARAVLEHYIETGKGCGPTRAAAVSRISRALINKKLRAARDQDLTQHGLIVSDGTSLLPTRSALRQEVLTLRQEVAKCTPQPTTTH